LRPETLKFTTSKRNCATKSISEVRKQTPLIERKEQCEVAKQCKCNPNKFWKYVNSKSKSQTNIGDIKTVDSKALVSVVSSDEDKANVFGDYFAGVYNYEPDSKCNVSK